MTNAEYFAPLELGEPKEPDVVVLQLIDESGGAQPPVLWVDGICYGSYDWDGPTGSDKTTGYVDWLENEEKIVQMGLLPFVCRAIGRWQQQGPFEVDRLLEKVEDPYGGEHLI